MNPVEHRLSQLADSRWPHPSRGPATHYVFRLGPDRVAMFARWLPVPGTDRWDWFMLVRRGVTIRLTTPDQVDSLLAQAKRPAPTRPD